MVLKNGLLNVTVGKLHTIMQALPGSATSIFFNTKLSYSGLCPILRSLESSGLARSGIKGRSIVYELTPAGRKFYWMINYCREAGKGEAGDG